MLVDTFSASYADPYIRHLKSVNGAADTRWSLIQNVGVNHRGFDIAVAEQFLNCSNIVTGLKKMGRE
jgi:hypothetical protein